MRYESAGMMEFIVDMLSSDFDFMEMSTRLHVTLGFYLIIFS
jgi:acetyl/propionyl-CoA carboxylase alpha subunit